MSISNRARLRRLLDRITASSERNNGERQALLQRLALRRRQRECDSPEIGFAR